MTERKKKYILRNSPEYIYFILKQTTTEVKRLCSPTVVNDVSSSMYRWNPDAG